MHVPLNPFAMLMVNDSIMKFTRLHSQIVKDKGTRITNVTTFQRLSLQQNSARTKSKTKPNLTMNMMNNPNRKSKLGLAKVLRKTPAMIISYNEQC